jgi:DNA methyltransferase 1-associated protein 1
VILIAIMAAADVRDMLDLPAEGQPRPQKKQKVVEKRPEGITRELYALLGERAPPIAINENRYKGRPKWMSKLRVRPWYALDLRSFDVMSVLIIFFSLPGK